MASALKIGLFGVHRGAQAEPVALSRRARLAEQAGFESIWVGDHVSLPMGSQAVAAYPPEQHRLEAIGTLCYLAAVTTRVRLGVGVIVVPQRQPLLLAKQLTTVDVLSKGRLIFGIGVGYVESELRALGVSMSERALRTDEYLAAIRAAWDESAPDFSGRFVEWSELMQRPLPVQKPHPPVVVGGSSAAAYRRALRSANGFFGHNWTLEETRRNLAEIRELALMVERPKALGELELTITPREPLDLDIARRYAELGVHRLAILPRDLDSPTATEELIQQVGETVIGRL
ncbi:MAG: TIGR03619 family F420-dependent LLM class oxidoreductase [Chloroflexota bacterium]